MIGATLTAVQVLSQSYLVRYVKRYGWTTTEIRLLPDGRTIHRSIPYDGTLDGPWTVSGVNVSLDKFHRMLVADGWTQA